MTPAFAEQDASHPQLAKKKADRRNDQQALADAADYLSTKYRDLYGEQIMSLLDYAEETGDLETFRQRVESLMEEPPPESATTTVENATFYSRLMGLFRGQR